MNRQAEGQCALAAVTEYLKTIDTTAWGRYEVYLSAMKPYTVVVATEFSIYSSRPKLELPVPWAVDFHTCGAGIL